MKLTRWNLVRTFVLGGLVGCWGAAPTIADSEPTVTSIQIYAAKTGDTSRVDGAIAGDDVLLPSRFVSQMLGLERKQLDVNVMGWCRADRCVPITMGTEPGNMRQIANEEYVPVQPLAKGFGGIFVWAARERELLIDLSGTNDRAKTGDNAPFDLDLPTLDGKIVSLSSYRGKKVMLFAWASW